MNLFKKSDKTFFECPYCHKAIDCDYLNNKSSDTKKSDEDLTSSESDFIIGDSNSSQGLSLEDWENSNFY